MQAGRPRSGRGQALRYTMQAMPLRYMVQPGRLRYTIQSGQARRYAVAPFL